MFYLKHSFVRTDVSRETIWKGILLGEEIWTVKAALDWTVGYLERKGDESPLVSAQWLLSEATGLSRVELYVNHDRPLSMPERDLLRAYVTRRGRGEPLQYITGEVGFRHLTIKVRPGVLIPRPETEVLVSEVLAWLPSAKRPRSAEFLAELADGSGVAAAPGVLGAVEAGSADLVAGERFASASGPASASAPAVAFGAASVFASSADSSGDTQLLVADICTGSGCIACSIAYEHPGTHVVATDISSAALALARENVDRLELAERVEVLQGDLGEAVPEGLTGSFDAVVSNPPYVPTAVLEAIPGEVADYEPALALDGGADGLDLYRRLLVWTLRALKPRGFFACELHETCLDAAAELARSAGFENVRVVYDLAGKPRVLTAVRP